MLDGSRSAVECALDEVLVTDEIEVVPDAHTAFPGLERAGTEWTSRLDEAGALRTVAACEAEIARMQAVQLRALARLGEVRGDTRSATAEVALATSTTESRARNQLALAETVTTRLPHTLAAMEAGTVDSYKAGRVADATSVLDDTTARHVDEALADRLAGKNPTAIRQAASRVVARLDPHGAEQRAAHRRRERGVDLLHHGEGLATLSADLPAETAQAIHTRLDRTARTRRGPGEERTLDQLRADVLAEWCLGGTGGSNVERARTGNADTDGTGGPGGIGPAEGTRAGTAGQARAEVFLHVSTETLAGASNDPAELTGHGPVPAAIARAIAHDPNATWRRIITDPANGQILDVGRTRYRPPAALDDLVRIRDRTCRHPGCQRPSQHGDLDHHIEWSTQDGHTSASNLIGFCRNHHRLKDSPGWSHHLDDNGTLTVTTPTRREYVSPAEPPPF